jgi:hypothetical protein
MSARRARRARGEGAIYRRADGVWLGAVELGWHDGKRRRRYVTGKTYGEVSKKLAKLRRAAQRGQLPKRRVPKVSEWLRVYLKEVDATSVRPSTLYRYEQEVRLYIGPELGHFRIDKIRPQHLTAFTATNWRGSRQEAFDGCTLCSAVHSRWRCVGG